MKLIPVGSSEVMGLEGLKKPQRVELIKVADTSVVFKGQFVKGQKPVEQNYSLQQIISIRRIDAGHTALRIVFGVIGGSAIAAAISNQEPNSAYIIIVGAVVTSIPFLMPRRDWKLGKQKYQLVIR